MRMCYSHYCGNLTQCRGLHLCDNKGYFTTYINIALFTAVLPAPGECIAKSTKYGLDCQELSMLKSAYVKNSLTHSRQPIRCQVWIFCNLHFNMGISGSHPTNDPLRFVLYIRCCYYKILLSTYDITLYGSDLSIWNIPNLINLVSKLPLPWQPWHNYSVIYWSWMFGWMHLKRRRP